MNKYYKGDDFDAFDEEWAIIELDIPEDWVVSKAKFKVGCLPAMVFDNEPVFPKPVALDSSQSINLKDVSTCYMCIYDEKGRKRTLEGSWTFVAEDEVIE